MPPFADVQTVDLKKALTAVGNVVCGGAALIENLLFIRRAVPLLNLNINEFERPPLLATVTTDRLAREFVSGDKD